MAGLERLIPAMGSMAHLVIVGGTADLLDAAADRLCELESRWSRFLPTSEVSRHNAALAAGEPTPGVSDDTNLLFDRAALGYQITAGRFDPYRLAELTAAGYGESLDRYGRSPLAVDLLGEAPRSGFDPGGIGKGLAADLVTADIMAAGADGALVSVGGDLRVRGCNPDGESWRIDIEDPRDGSVVETVLLDDGAVATSSQLKRRWMTADGSPRHHLLDPATGTSATSPVLSATIIAAEAWQAEILSKVAFLDADGEAAFTHDAGLELIESLGAAALVVTPDLVATTSQWARFELTKAGRS